MSGGRQAAAARAAALEALSAELCSCRACPRLVAWREEVARVRRRAHAAQAYWGRPVPGFGDPAAPLLVLGLAPGAHGANRTGRVFTGDASGEFLYAALHRAGLASQPESRGRDDGLALRGAWLSNAVRCVPPGNAPAPDELRRCAPFLWRELAVLRPRAVLALGAVAWAAALAALAEAGHALPRPRPHFAHRAELRLPGAPALLASYHVSQQNTRTGRLTAAMFDAVLRRAVTLAAAR
jgi:uracil-DNA glycosylase